MIFNTTAPVTSESHSSHAIIVSYSRTIFTTRTCQREPHRHQLQSSSFPLSPPRHIPESHPPHHPSLPTSQTTTFTATPSHPLTLSQSPSPRLRPQPISPTHHLHPCLFLSDLASTVIITHSSVSITARTQDMLLVPHRIDHRLCAEPCWEWCV